MKLEYLFTTAAIGWAAALPLADFVASLLHPTVPLSMIALVVYAAGSIVCHQLPDRSFHLWSAQMPVCARCTGIYAGAAIAAAMLLTMRAGRRGGPRRPSEPETVRRIVAAAALPTLATLIVEWTAWHTPSNAIRALAGLPLGGAVAWVIGAALVAGEHGAREDA